MEEWKKIVLIGVILIILAALFSIFKGITVWTVLIIILAVLDIAVGLYRKKNNVEENYNSPSKTSSAGPSMKAPKAFSFS